LKLVAYILLLPFFSNSQVINTYAGDGDYHTTYGGGYYSGDGGQATNAELSSGPMGINFDKNGDLLICHHDLIRKVNTLTGIITTIAGDTSATAIGNGGLATNALVDEPYSVCIDATGNIFISDYWANEIRKIDISTGIIDVYAGIGTNGYGGDGGSATNAKFNSVFRVYVDTSLKALYISDEYNYRVRKVDMVTNIITTYAGTGTTGYSGDNIPATNAKLSRVLGLCSDRFGNLYIGDYDNGRIRKVEATTGIISTFAGTGVVGYSGNGGPATNAMISEVSSICFDSCWNMYFADGSLGGGNYCIRRIDAVTNIITTVVGRDSAGFYGDGGDATAALITRPTGLCIDKYNNLYISDIDNYRVRKVNLSLISCESGTTNIKPIPTNASISIYPNPASTTIAITSPNKISQIAISNLLGQTEYSNAYDKEKIEINIANLPPGIYMVAIIDEEGNKNMKKILKE
jgi:hypothetical protein